MKLIGSNYTANDISFGSVTNGEDFLLATLDWRDFDFKIQYEICDKIGYGEYADELSGDDISISLVVPRVGGVLDFDHCYLHILTIGIVTIEDVTRLVKSQINAKINADTSLIEVSLNPYERIDILNRIIKPTDLRKVV